MKLSEIIELEGGGTPSTKHPEYWNGSIPWLAVADFNTGRKYVYTASKFITEAGLKYSSTKVLNSGDIIISARGTVGALAILKEPMAFNQSCYGIRGIHGVSETDYIYYCLKYSVNDLLQISYGGVFDTITTKTFDDIVISLPSLSEQRAIASVLSSLDDKIDLLHRENATLEKMAETLFRQWFIEEASDDWEEKSCLDYFTIVGGGTPKTAISTYWNGDICWLSGGDISQADKTFVFDSEKKISKHGLQNSSAKLLPQFSIVITARGTVGKFCILGRPMAYSQTNYGIVTKIESAYFFTFLLVNHIVDMLKSSAYGSVFDTITTNTFSELMIKLPTNKTISEFENMISAYFRKIFTNQKQIQSLEKLRDTVLPKLMSGEVRVNVE